MRKWAKFQYNRTSLYERRVSLRTAMVLHSLKSRYYLWKMKIWICKQLSIVCRPNTQVGDNPDGWYLNVSPTWWRHQMETFSALLAICAWNSTVNSMHKGQRHGALMFSLICARINGWVNNRDAGDLRCHRAHYDVIVMKSRGIDQDRKRVTLPVYSLYSQIFEYKVTKHPFDI